MEKERIAAAIKTMQTYAYNLTSDNDDTHDLMQDTFLQACRYINKTPSTDSELKRWLHVMMRNLFISRYRAGKKRITVTLNEYKFFAGPEWFSRLQLQDVLKELQKFDEHKRMCLLLYADGYKYEEIEIIMDMKLNTVKSHIHHIRQALQKKFPK